jgi:uncharacterized protein
MLKVLITGGSGLIGKAISEKLHSQNYEIRILGREEKKSSNAPFFCFHWNVDKEIIDIKALENIDYIIHLAGENISKKRWTNEQKQVIENSRVNSTKLIFKACQKSNSWPKAFISSSAIGYYGTFNSEQILTEELPAGGDFLARVCKNWESASDLFAQRGIRTVKIRTGVVLSKNDGIYQKMAIASKKGFAAAFGSGKQYIPWIHIDDIVSLYIKAIEDEQFQGDYNGVASQHISNKEFVKAIAKSLNKPAFLPNIPSFILKIIFGEMSDIMLKGCRVSSDKILRSGFTFKFPSITEAFASFTNT